MTELAKRLRPAQQTILWVAIIAFAYTAAIYVGASIAQLVGIDSLTGRLALHSFLLVVMVGIVVMSPSVLMNEPRLTLADMGLRRLLSWKQLAFGVLGFFAYAAIITLVVPLIQNISWFDADQPQELGFEGMMGWSLLLGFVVLVLVTPIVEEILFRGVLQGKLRVAGVPFALTAVIVGALFAAAHGQWNVAVDVFFMSLVASYVRERTGQLWASIIIHILKNMLAFYVTFVLVSGAL